MEFIEIKKSAYLSVDQMNAIQNNIGYLKEQFESLGHNLDDVSTGAIDYSISPTNIILEFNAVEENIQAIHRAFVNEFGTTESNYKNFEWEFTTPNRQAEVWRWIDWLYEVKDMLSAQSDYEILYDYTGSQVFDSNNEEILVLKESA